jgi:peptidoglycan/LPS O-acetylase OafA/YrhL
MGEIQGVSTSERTDKPGWHRPRTRRNIAAAALLVYGSTFLWMTASFAGTSSPPGGATWATATVGALVSLALFTLAAWGVFRSKWWWERAASAGAIVGLATLVPYWIAASSTPEPALNKPIHIVGSAAVLLVLLVPALERRLKAWLSDPDSPAPAGRRSR